jgi:hypothetical protein
MTADLHSLQNVTTYPDGDHVQVGNGAGLKIKHIGQGSIFLNKNAVLALKKILHVPKLAAHLLSVYQLCKDNNCRMIFDEFCFYIQDKVTGQVLFQGMSDNGLYPIPVTHLNKMVSSSSCPTAFLGAQISQSLWHQRLGHPSNVITSSMLSKSKVSATADSSSIVCESCLAGKFTRLPFPKSSTKSVIPFEVIHSDVWGPSPHTSIEGFRYYLTFIDECTRYCWIFPLHNKAQVCSVFLSFHAFVSTQFSTSIKILQTDGGGEYVGRSLQTFLLEHGIVHHKSCPYTPQQNGLAERKKIDT